jgi:hypothetical protein
MGSQEVGKCAFLSFRRKPEFSLFIDLQNIRTQVFIGVTTSYESIQVQKERCREKAQGTGRTVKGRFEAISQQRMAIVRINDHAYLIPCAQGGNEVLLKKIIPSKKATNKYVRVEK